MRKKICWEIRNWVGLHPVICSIGIIAIIILIPYGFFPLYNSFFPLPAKDGFSLKEHSAIVNNEYLNLVLLQYDSNNTVKRIVIPSSDKSNNAFMPDEQTIVFFKKEADKFSEWKYINGNTTQIGVVTDPNSIIPTSSNIKPNLEVKKNYNGGCNSGGGVGAPGAHLYLVYLLLQIN